MTTSKWIGALGVLMVFVFGLTFVLNYTGQAPTSDNSVSTVNDDLPRLTFGPKSFPYFDENHVPVGTYELEHRKAGFQDYAFVNENDEKVRIGAIEKSCKCQAVEVYVLPLGQKTRKRLAAPHPLLTMGMGPLGWSALQEFVDEYGANKDLDAVAESVTILNPEDASAVAEVPPHREGWVRMRWTGEKAGKMNLTVKLWENSPGIDLVTSLERQSNFVEPVVLVGSDAGLGNLKLTDLPKSGWFYVWSWTRKSFNITKKSLMHPSGLAESSDSLEVGEPIPLTISQCALASSSAFSRVWSGYRIPITLKKSAKDGSPCEIGNFRRRIEVQTDASDTPLKWTLSGVVRGDMRIANVDDSGGISFGSFRRDSPPAPRSVLLQSAVPGLKLEVDERRLPDFLRASISREPDSTEQFSKWKLEIRVLPSVYGQFPREDEPGYRDSAVYVRSVGTGPRQTIRIAVRGDAGNG
jgi:hypothetical protein